MEALVRLVKSITIALAFITLALVALALLVWTKGLFLLLAVFTFAVYVIYHRIEHREHSMRKEDRKWF